jgi:pilus assembly protein Flp/PilA
MGPVRLPQADRVARLSEGMNAARLRTGRFLPFRPAFLASRPFRVHNLLLEGPDPLRPVSVTWNSERGRKMRQWFDKVRAFAQDESGPTAVEYAVMLALIIVVAIGGISLLGTNASKVFSNVALNTAAAGS